MLDSLGLMTPSVLEILGPVFVVRTAKKVSNYRIPLLGLIAYYQVSYCGYA